MGTSPPEGAGDGGTGVCCRSAGAEEAQGRHNGSTPGENPSRAREGQRDVQVVDLSQRWPVSVPFLSSTAKPTGTSGAVGQDPREAHPSRKPGAQHSPALGHLV